MIDQTCCNGNEVFCSIFQMASEGARRIESSEAAELLLLLDEIETYILLFDYVTVAV